MVPKKPWRREVMMPMGSRQRSTTLLSVGTVKASSPLIAFMLCVGLGCGPVGNPASGGTSGSGMGGQGGGSPNGDAGPIDRNPDGPICGEQNFMLQRGTPDILIVQDISESMDVVVGSASKWDQIKSAINATVTNMALQTQI